LFFCTASAEMLVAAGQGEIEALRKAEVDVSPNPDSLSSSNLACLCSGCLWADRQSINQHSRMGGGAWGVRDGCAIECVGWSC